MPPEILALLNKPELMVAVLGVGAVFGIAAERFMAALRRQAWRARNRQRRPQRRPYSFDYGFWPNRHRPNLPRGAGEGDRAKRGGGGSSPPASTTPDAADQLRIVMAADFTVQPLLNKSEARLFRALDAAVIARNPAWQVMAQVSLGEVLQSANPEAFRCINSKRVDLLLMDEHCQARCVIEYQGAGHHQGNAAARDAVKKEALRRAGVEYEEVVAGKTTPTELRRLVERLVDSQASPANTGTGSPFP